MRLAALVFLAAALWGEQPGLVRGVLLECGGGEFSVRAPSHQVYRFRFDEKTYFEREKLRATADKLEKGDTVEVVADAVETPGPRYARTVHVLDAKEPAAKPSPPVSLGRYRAYRRAVEAPAPPSGNLTLTGVVARVLDGSMVLRMRQGGEKTILLREDTRYLEGGVQVDRAALAPATTVFVRGSRNINDQVEAYQVVWGEILRPER